MDREDIDGLEDIGVITWNISKHTGESPKFSADNFESLQTDVIFEEIDYPYYKSILALLAAKNDIVKNDVVE